MRSIIIFLLLPLLQLSLAYRIDWAECKNKMTCLVDAACLDENEPRLTSLGHYKWPRPDFACGTALVIRPTSKQQWWVRLFAQELGADKELRLELPGSGAPLFTCFQNAVTPGTDNMVAVPANEAPPGYAGCTFMMQAASGDQVVSLFGGNGTAVGGKSVLVVDTARVYISEANVFQEVDHNLGCDKSSLFLPASECDDDEICAEVEESTHWNCPAGTYQVFRQSASSDYALADITCAKGAFDVVDASGSGRVLKITSESRAKCARKRCSLCADPAFAEMRLERPAKPSFDTCGVLRCDNTTHFMALNGGQTTSGRLKCAPQSTKDAALWMVDDKATKITRASCEQKLPCDVFNTVMTGCNRDEALCRPARRDRSGGFNCAEGSLHLRVSRENATTERIAPPVCDDSGKWNITFLQPGEETNSTLSPAVQFPLNSTMRIRCMLAPPTPATPEERRLAWWLIVAIVLVVSLIIALSVGYGLYARRRRSLRAKLQLQQQASSQPSSGSSASSESASASSSNASGESEPLTSTLRSVTGKPAGGASSKQQQQQRRPLLMATTDIRGVTAAAAARDQPSTITDISAIKSSYGESEMGTAAVIPSAETSKLLPSGTSVRRAGSSDQKNKQFLNVSESESEASKTGSVKRKRQN